MSRLSRQHQIGPVAIDSTAVLAATGVQSEDLQTRLINQIVHALHLPSRLSREELGQRIKAAVAALEEIKPRDGVEGMLGVQIVATHEAVRIPAQSGQVFRFKAGQHSGMKPDTVPINHRTLSPL
jgi:hypothetical protein